jgi:transcriptional regulator with XRE-family HTH domain
LIYLHENLRKIREAKNLTQKAFADIFAINKTTYANYETGYSSPDYLFLEQISRTYGIPADELLYTQLPDEKIARLIKDTVKGGLYEPGSRHSYLNESVPGYGRPCKECTAKDQVIQAQATTIASLQSALNMAQARIDELQAAKKKKPGSPF